jgi:hypothetical protein
MFEIIFGGLVAASLVTTYITNPFSRLSIIRLPFRIKLDQKVHETINNNAKIKVKNQWYWRWFAMYQSGLYILTTRYFHSPAADGKTVDEIIANIHRLRYDPNKLLLISGDHFNGLFVRNLGVFYYPMLDPALPTTHEDWNNRQTVYLQSVAYALGVFAKSPRLTTTIVSTGPYAATCVNFYAYPSDSLYGILYALAALSGYEAASPYHYAKDTQVLDTKLATSHLIKQYHDTLCELYEGYCDNVIDQQTGLIRRGLHLSGAKDITRRSSSFYDNVIYWKTTQLSMKLGLIPDNKKQLKDLKKQIIEAFWLPDVGYFVEDLSDEGLNNKYYSSDWLIVLATGFLDPFDIHESQYYIRSVDYIQKEKIDQPFAIKYQQNTRAHRQFLPVRLAVASYGGDAIWSFWGMEYIKVLVLLYKKTGDGSYKQTAKYHIDKYETSMIANSGFPEVYDPKGKLLQTPFYRSIRQTGWVIGFEQARQMYRVICK